MKSVYLHLNQLLTLKSAQLKNGRRLVPSDLDIIEDGAIAFENGLIAWVGQSEDLPAMYNDWTQHNL